jgi:hypothetical protein
MSWKDWTHLLINKLIKTGKKCYDWNESSLIQCAFNWLKEDNEQIPELTDEFIRFSVKY